MAKTEDTATLHAKISRLLMTRSAGRAVKVQLDQTQADWQARVVIADLRLRRARDAALRELDAADVALSATHAWPGRGRPN